MKSAVVYYRKSPAGVLTRSRKGYGFRYLGGYLRDASTPSVSMTLPKRGGTFRSKVLFPFFFGILTEGVQKEMQCRLMKIDENDYFTRLVRTSKYGAVGAVHVREKGDLP